MKVKILLTIIILICAITVPLLCYYHGWLGHHIILRPTKFSHLPGWQQDDHQQALVALKNSCSAIAKLNPERPFSSKIPQSGKVKTWHTICTSLTKFMEDQQIASATAARTFFEFWFTPYRVYDNLKTHGLFTGYYLPTLHCTLQPSNEYQVPIHARPPDWVKVDLGKFTPKLQGTVIVGQIKNQELRPYPDRAAINSGIINKDTAILAWCNDKVAVAFAHIQGSAKVALPDQQQFLIGYAASNGHNYTSLGKILIKQHQLTKENCSLQSIRDWLHHHPEQSDHILNRNRSYVFFRIVKSSEPLGSQQVPLTAQRSLAVDKRYIPLGVPIWLETTIPTPSASSLPWRCLLVAQDTGGAIKGIIRGDLYWGSGAEAEFIAGHMQSSGQYWLLLPRSDIED